MLNSVSTGSCASSFLRHDIADRSRGCAPSAKAMLSPALLRTTCRCRRFCLLSQAEFPMMGANVTTSPPVLLHGETATGKGLVACVMRDRGPRVQGPFLDVNCAAIPEALLEAGLFGYEVGAFTGARCANRASW